LNVKDSSRFVDGRIATFPTAAGTEKAALFELKNECRADRRRTSERGATPNPRFVRIDAIARMSK
jgi:hypothetical protein